MRASALCGLCLLYAYAQAFTLGPPALTTARRPRRATAPPSRLAALPPSEVEFERQELMVLLDAVRKTGGGPNEREYDRPTVDGILAYMDTVLQAGSPIEPSQLRDAPNAQLLIGRWRLAFTTDPAQNGLPPSTQVYLDV